VIKSHGWKWNSNVFLLEVHRDDRCSLYFSRGKDMQRWRQETVGRPGWNGGLDSSWRPHTRLHAAVERISSVPILDSSAHEPARQPVGYASSARKSRTRERGSVVLSDLRERACTVITVDRVIWRGQCAFDEKEDPAIVSSRIFPKLKVHLSTVSVSRSSRFSFPSQAISQIFIFLLTREMKNSMMLLTVK